MKRDEFMQSLKHLEWNKGFCFTYYYYYYFNSSLGRHTVHYSALIVEKLCVSVYVRDDNVTERDRWAL